MQCPVLEWHVGKQVNLQCSWTDCMAQQGTHPGIGQSMDRCHCRGRFRSLAELNLTICSRVMTKQTSAFFPDFHALDLDLWPFKVKNAMSNWGTIPEHLFSPKVNPIILVDRRTELQRYAPKTVPVTGP